MNTPESRRSEQDSPPVSQEAFNAVDTYARDESGLLKGRVRRIVDDPGLAEDVVQQALLNVLFAYDRAKAKREAEGEAFNLGGYLWTTARNVAFAELRRRNTQETAYNNSREDYDFTEIPVSPVQPDGLGGTKYPNPEIVLLEREEQAQVRDAFHTLPDTDQELIKNPVAETTGYRI